jgi:predicted nucleic acid-binding protein
MNLFFDTSALVKLFHEEVGSEAVAEMVCSPDNQIWVLELVRLEFLSAVFRRHRNHELDTAGLTEAISAFDEQICSFHLEPLGHATLREAELLLQQYGAEESLRALDALHLAACCLIAADGWVFVCADKTLCAVAEQAGLRTSNPID